MNFDLKLTKKDIITMVLLSIVFFGIATWNVGEVKAPVTNWQSTTQQSFYVDLGSSQQVQTVYFWVSSGNASVDVSSGAPGNWSYLRAFSLQRQSHRLHGPARPTCEREHPVLGVQRYSRKL